VLAFRNGVDQVSFIGFDQRELPLDGLPARQPIRITSPRFQQSFLDRNLEDSLVESVSDRAKEHLVNAVLIYPQGRFYGLPAPITLLIQAMALIDLD
jgi:hypothetical protein